MELADLLPARIVRASGRQLEIPDVAVLEDERELADLAVELCAGLGLSAERFGTSAAYNATFGQRRPRLVILDWRLEREVAAAVYMGLRHRFEDLPVVIWTATGQQDLPSMVAADPHTTIVRKASGIDQLEAAIRGAVASTSEKKRRSAMMEGFKVPRNPHPEEPDELTPDTLPLDDVERPHDGGQGPHDPPEEPAKDLDEPGSADRTPRP